jgi:beta-aspartyl-peptidase (threonine type)
MHSIIVHGGVGAVPGDKEQVVVDGVREAVLAGSGVLDGGGSSLDAAVAYGPTLGFGAVAGIRNIQYPISLARMVMEKTDHVLLQGDGAQEFARMMGLAPHNPITEERRTQWRAYREKFLRGDAGDWPKLRALMKEPPEFMHGTVGAVAVDEQGEVAARVPPREASSSSCWGASAIPLCPAPAPMQRSSAGPPRPGWARA